MDPKKVTIRDIDVIFRKLKKGDEASIGNYLYRGIRIQISKYKSSGTERYMRLYNKRRAEGLCIRCGTKVTKKNPSTGKLYRLCEHHRKLTDRRD